MQEAVEGVEHWNGCGSVTERLYVKKIVVLRATLVKVSE